MGTATARVVCQILSGGEDGTVRIHDALTGEQRLVFYGHTAPVVDVDFSPDGKLVAAITTDGSDQSLGPPALERSRPAPEATGRGQTCAGDSLISQVKVKRLKR